MDSAGLNSIIKTLLRTTRGTVLFIIILLLGGALTWVWLKKPQKIEVEKEGQCDYVIEQNKQLIDFFFNKKAEIDALANDSIRPTAYHRNAESFIWAILIDTIPKKKLTAKEQLKKISIQFDSILRANNLDSLKRIDSMKKMKQKKG